VAGPGSTGEVVSIRGRANYRPDYKRLASGQVAVARAKLGLSHAEFADYLGDLLGWTVSAAAVERWEQGSIPPGDVLLASAVAAQDMPGDVLSFPLNATAERTAALLSAVGPAVDLIGDPTETVLPYADRGLISRQQWNGIIQGAASHLWLYGMAEFGYATDDDVPAIISDAVGAGCQVRVLLLDPGYSGMADIDAGEGSPPGTLATRIRAALARFTQMREAAGPQMQLRTYDTHPTVSVVRGDNRMLVTPYLRFSIGSNSPTFELTEASARKMFGRYARHFDHMWKLAKDLT
jgi:transcriptional regulator with XRE-family HTH domain